MGKAAAPQFHQRSLSFPSLLAVDRVYVQHADFDLSVELAALRDALAEADGRGNTGALVSFVGLVRADGAVRELCLEHYPGMSEKVLTRLIADARTRWDLQAVRVIHRVGRLAVGEQIVLLLVASSHRAHAFAACEYIMDFIKTEAPFWKRELGADGLPDSTGGWVQAKGSDDNRAARWQRL